ncbi:MAG: hypothetical protein QOI46_6467, partial [Alphaproteobacteria bacterium]|nr:hypothetical protein [Alphaproteobacteria bacterium]
MAGIEPFEGRAVNAILFDPSEKAADLAAGITIAGALGRSHPALFCTRTPYSSLRLRRLIGEASLPAQNIAIASEQSLTARDIEVLVHSSSEIPPVSRELGQRRIWHCPIPTRVGAMSDSETRMRLEALERITAIVTGSEIAKRKLLGALSYIGAPCPPV